MKKTSLLLASMAVIFSAGAKAVPAVSAMPETAGMKMVSSIQKADGQPTITGDWTFSLIEMDGNNIASEPELVKIQAQYVNGEVYFTDPTIMEYFQGILPFFAEFNAATNTLTFNKAYLQVTWEGYYPFQEPFTYNRSTGEYTYQSITARYSPEEGTITFDDDNGIAWAKYSEATAENLQGYYYKYMLTGALREKDPVGSDNDWRDIGNATLMDGWILPAFDYNQNDKANWFEVPMQQNLGNPNLYRLVDPYHAPGFPALKENLSSKKGYIMIDISDPDNVVINGYKIDAGFLNYEVNCREFYCFNYLGSLVAKYPQYTVEEIKEIMGADMPFHTTYRDGVVMLSSVATDTGFSNDANYANQDAYYSTGGLGWMDYSGLFLNMAAMIVFPGADADNADTDTPIIDGIYYLLDRETMTATVTGCDDSISTLNVPSTITVKSGTYDVTSVASYSLEANTNLTSLIFNEGMKKIGISAFYHCDNISSIKLPEGIESLGSFAFSFCNLSEIEIPASVTYIGGFTFAGCSGVRQITCHAVKVPETDTLAFDDIDVTIPVYVPGASIPAYKEAYEWEEFTNYLPLPDSGIENIGNETGSSVEYYNLQGIKVENPENGIFIRRAGGKTSVMKF